MHTLAALWLRAVAAAPTTPAFLAQERGGWREIGWQETKLAPVRSELDALERVHERIGQNDPLTVVYTSGTTGPPKGCVLGNLDHAAMVEMEERGELTPTLKLRRRVCEEHDRAERLYAGGRRV